MLRTFLIAATAATALLVPVAVASADAASVRHCQTNRGICLFDGLNGGGDAFVTGQNRRVPDFRRLNTWQGRIGFNDRTESVINNTGLNWCFYRDINTVSPPVFRVRPHGGQIINLIPAHRNLASSMQPCDI